MLSSIIQAFIKIFYSLFQLPNPSAVSGQTHTDLTDGVNNFEATFVWHYNAL